MKNEQKDIIEHLQPIIGLKLSIARRAADLRNFQFGKIKAVKNGSVGEYALHIQCPWRIEGPDGIITGRSDLWEPAIDNPDLDWDTWSYESGENLQDKKIKDLMGTYDPDTRSYLNNNNELFVENVQVYVYGIVNIVLSGGYKIILFPDGSREEDWRFFRPDTNEPHFVICGGRIEQPE